MAVAAGPSDARIPCPQCGGLVHPIAGKCRHCKADLSSFRGARPAAASPLPALDTTPGKPEVVNAAPVAIAKEASQPVLPPRPTGQMAGQTARESQRSTWKSWPMLVIILATIAIVTALVIMVWPTSRVANAKHTLEPPPAPERMDTNSLTPSPTAPPVKPPRDPQRGPDDPWANPSPPHSSNTPSRRTPDPLPPSDPDLVDPFGHTGGMSGLGPLGGMAGLNAGLMKAMLQHGCDRLAACGSTDDMLRMTCKVGLDAVKNAPPPPTCPAAERCIKKLDQLDCAIHVTGFSDLLTLLPDAQDCLAALAC
jgi:hypothetical protein